MVGGDEAPKKAGHNWLLPLPNTTAPHPSSHAAHSFPQIILYLHTGRGGERGSKESGSTEDPHPEGGEMGGGPLSRSSH